MSKRKIFIASARESKDTYAKPIAQKLSDEGFEAVRWWEAFRLGDFTLERLLELARDCSGGVFICKSTDVNWYHGREHEKPRDNVILELGLFLQAHGPKFAVVVKDPGTELPSDLNGLTYIAAGDDVSSIAERVADHFKSQPAVSKWIGPDNASLIPVEADGNVTSKMLRGNVPATWHQRALYIGIDGARAWLQMSEEPNALEAVDQSLRRDQMLQAAAECSVDTFISMGPGSADLDKQIAANLPAHENELIYIPVDISEGLLHNAFTTLNDKTYIPVGILSDFEDRLKFIFDRINLYGKPPYLVGLLGNTLGNLDGYELEFLKELHKRMKPGDQLMLETAVAADDWSLAVDPHADVAHHSPLARRFHANGLSRQLQIAPEVIIENYEKRIIVRLGKSDVPKTAALEIVDKQTNKLVMSLRRYHLPTLVEWIENHFPFRLKLEPRSFLFNGQKVGCGVALFTRV